MYNIWAANRSCGLALTSSLNYRPLHGISQPLYIQMQSHARVNMLGLDLLIMKLPVDGYSKNYNLAPVYIASLKLKAA